MTRDDIKKLLNMLESDKITDRGGWVSASCPFSRWTHDGGYDRHPSFGISVDTDSHFNCYSCGKRGRVHILPNLLHQLSGQDTTVIRRFINAREGLFTVNDEGRKQRPLLPIPEASIKHFKHLTHRVGVISLESVALWELLFDPTETRLIFKIRDKYGRLVGIKGRYLGTDDSVLRYRAYSELTESYDTKTYGIWYGMHFPMDSNKYLFLVEGERDAICLRQAGVKNVWSSMGASISQSQLETLQRELKQPVVLYMDDDKAGVRAAYDVLTALRSYVPVYKIQNYHGHKDAGAAVEHKVIGKVLQRNNISLLH